MPTLLRWAVTGGLLLRAMFLRFLVPPRPGFLISRRTPFIDDATSEYSPYYSMNTVLSAFTTYVRIFFGIEYARGRRVEGGGQAACGVRARGGGVSREVFGYEIVSIFREVSPIQLLTNTWYA